MTLINKDLPKGKLIPFERYRESFQRQVAADGDAVATAVALAISWHLNRKDMCAFPGYRTIATLTGLHRNTVMNVVRRLETRGHLRVARGKIGRRRDRNRYYLLLRGYDVVAERSRNGGTGHVTRGTPIDVLGGTPIDVTEPLTEPLTEPQTLCKNIASIDMEASNISSTGKKKEGDLRGSKGSEIPFSVSPAASEPSPEKEAYRLAREYDGELGASRVARALNCGSDPRYVLADVAATVEDGGDLGEALAYHWKEKW